MLKSRGVVGPRVIIAGMTILAILVMLVAGGSPVTAKAFAQEEAAVEPTPPAGQTYIGAKRCSSCHFQQFMTWKSTPHAKAFSLLTAKYEKDETCLQCHTTGFGTPSGYKAGETTLEGVTCENCHGPGSKHEEAAQPYAKTKELPADAEKTIRDAIWKVMPSNACIGCHKVQGHGKSSTPADMVKK